MEIVRAKKDDINIIQGLQKNDGFEHAYLLTQERLNTLLDRNEIFLIAYMYNLPVGMISVDVETRAMLHFLSVEKTRQRMGIGTALLLEAFKLIKKKKPKVRVLFMYIEKDSPTQAFLTKNLFLEVGFYKSRYGPGRDGIIFEREI